MPDQIDKPAHLFILPWDIAHPGGVNQVVTNLYEEYGSHGRWRPMLMIADWSYPAMALKREDGFDKALFRMLAPFDSKHPVRGLVRYLLGMPAQCIVLSRFLRRNRIAVINPHYPGLSTLTFVVLKKLRLFRGKIVLSFHGLDISNAMQSRHLEKACWKYLIASADSVVTCSKSLADQVVSFSPGCKPVIVHNGIDAGRLGKESDRSFRIDRKLSDHPFILNIGTFEEKKGQDVLVRAYARIRAHFPAYRLVLIGRSGESENTIRGLIADCGLDEYVVIVKDLPHQYIAAYLERADMFVLPSRIEPFGIVVLEAGVFGLPVIATATGGVTEILEQGETGLLVPADDVDALAEQILFVLHHPAEAQRMAANLKRHVLMRFGWDEAYRRYVNEVGEASGAHISA
ncbi:MAG TPA: glycosyltransferase family 4 protein [Burkholderiales bacterium]|nr:glycosyltransferase family 4 protein [Burkholderiales bacterium]